MQPGKNKINKLVIALAGCRKDRPCENRGLHPSKMLFTHLTGKTCSRAPTGVPNYLQQNFLHLKTGQSKIRN